MGSLDLVPWLPGFNSWFHTHASMVAWQRFLHGCLTSVPVSLDLVPWLPGKVSRLPGFNSWFHGCLVKVSGCLNSLPGSFDLVPWLPHQGSWLHGLGPPFPQDTLLPAFTFWLPPLNSLVAWSRFLVSWTWFGDCLKAPGCLHSLSDSLSLVPWLPG